jgi:hemerythrin
MNKFNWLDEFEIGNTIVDAQHKHLFELANKVFATTDRQVIKNCAFELFRYIRQHFKDEELLMQQMHYPNYQNHVEAHNDLLIRLEEISAPFNGEDFNVNNLNVLMIDWLHTHILREDMQIGEFLRQNS